MTAKTVRTCQVVHTPKNVKMNGFASDRLCGYTNETYESKWPLCLEFLIHITATETP